MLFLSDNDESAYADASDNTGADKNFEDEECNSSIVSPKFEFKSHRNRALNMSKEEYYTLKES